MKMSQLQMDVVYAAGPDYFKYPVKVIDFTTKYSKSRSYSTRYYKDAQGKFLKCLMLKTTPEDQNGTWEEDYFMPQQITSTWEEWLEIKKQRELDRLAKSEREQRLREHKVNVHKPAVDSLIAILRTMGKTNSIYGYTQIEELPTHLINSLITALSQTTPPDNSEDIDLEDLGVLNIEEVEAITEESIIDEPEIDYELIAEAKAANSEISPMFLITTKQIEGEVKVPTQLTKASYRGFHWDITAHGRYINLNYKYNRNGKYHYQSLWFTSVNDALYVIQYELIKYQKSM